MQIRQFMCSTLQHMSFLQLSLSEAELFQAKQRNVNYGNHVKLELVFSVHSTKFPTLLLHWGFLLMSWQAKA